MPSLYRSAIIAILLFSFASPSSQAQEQGPPKDISDRMVAMFFLPYEYWNEGFHLLADEWRRSHTPMAIEMLSLARGEMAYRFLNLLQQKTGEDFGLDANACGQGPTDFLPHRSEGVAPAAHGIVGVINDRRVR